MKTKSEFSDLVLLAFRREALKKVVFSRPTEGKEKKIVCRLVAHRGKRMLATETTLPGDTVSQENFGEEAVASAVSERMERFAQVNLITTLGEAEYKCSGDKTVFLGADKLVRKLTGEAPAFESAMESLDQKKSYILTGAEPFLFALGISSRDGRIHDKWQGKFRQINRFLEMVGDVYDKLPAEGVITVYDLCSGKSYLSFAVYHYLTVLRGRTVDMLAVDLKADVLRYCEDTAKSLGFHGMRFLCADITGLDEGKAPDLVLSLHACDGATDIVLDNAVRLGAGVILSTPCCHRELSRLVNCPALSFVTKYPKLSDKLCEALTDGLRLLRLKANGYRVSALELVDPTDTPKNTLLRAVYTGNVDDDARAEYERALAFLLGDGVQKYDKRI